MSEQRQLNVKNLLNADPSFRSVVDLGREERKEYAEGIRRHEIVNREGDSENFTINYLGDRFTNGEEDEDEGVAIVALASDGHGSCIPIFDQVPRDLQQHVMTHAVNEHDSRLPVSAFPNSLLISFSPQPAPTYAPASSFRDAPVQGESKGLKVTDPLAADSVKGTDEDERASEPRARDDGGEMYSAYVCDDEMEDGRKEEGNENDDDDEEEEEEGEEEVDDDDDDDESSAEETVNCECDGEEQCHISSRQHPDRQLVCRVCGCHLFKGSAQLHEKGGRWLIPGSNNNVLKVATASEQVLPSLISNNSPSHATSEHLYTEPDSDLLKLDVAERKDTQRAEECFK